MTDKENETEPGYELIWVAKEMIDSGWDEFRDGVIYHHDWYIRDIVRRDERGNYLIRRPKGNTDEHFDRTANPSDCQSN